MPAEDVSSWKTAIKRNKPSSIVSHLESEKLIVGEVLDYGCGRGDDLTYLDKKGYRVGGYDPHWQPANLVSKKYDTILCTYVLNVLSVEESDIVIEKIKSLLAPNGIAYLSVRRAIKADGKTTRGFQRNVLLGLPIVKEVGSRFCIYKLLA